MVFWTRGRSSSAPPKKKLIILYRKKINMQIVYCGTNTKVENPTIIKGKYTKDFGEGFYCTILKDQAIRWSKKYSTPVVNIYEYKENDELTIKEFAIMSEEWLDFIVDSRAGKDHNYDIVIGPMADDQVYNYINDFILGNITREQFWQLAKFSYPTHQIAFCTIKALESLRFISSEGENDGK